MALTESEAKVLGALSALDVAGAMSVRQLCGRTGLNAAPIRRALRRLSNDGLALGTQWSPASWRCTDRGRLAVGKATYRECAGAGS
ncbi:winged helix-turn-helix transcriptional regulator [Nocardia sp. NPDC051030]|uniref:winged helix-turn-helix transcriptional regulator n=1 Tax=Nocardia sp. NPDC051030 TaxID=3155162 RepID=UPI0034420E58